MRGGGAPIGDQRQSSRKRLVTDDIVERLFKIQETSQKLKSKRSLRPFRMGTNRPTTLEESLRLSLYYN